MSYIRHIFLLIALMANIGLYAQNKMRATVVDSDTNEPIIGASVAYSSSRKTVAITDVDGMFLLKDAASTELVISYIGYKSAKVKARNGAVYKLQPVIKTIGEVVVTAQESKSLSTSSVIAKHAMEHLQPSSFSDILELLPGGRAKDPSLTSPNTIHLREAIGGSGSYATNSLGTSFMIDGAPISTNANRQYVAGGWDSASSNRNFVNAGVDMRSIATDDIEKVEIVRGIPSVEYGDLTSGLVKIERRKGGNNITSRLKADMNSKLCYLAKGWEWKPKLLSMNLSVDYLDAKRDPRNILENYKRLTVSSRLNKQWNTVKYLTELAVNLDYTGSFDNEKQDPDLNNQVEDSYRSEYNRLALLGKIKVTAKKENFLKSLDLTCSMAYDHDLIERTGLVQLSRLLAAATTLQEGESDGVILPYKYTAHHEVDGKPFNAFIRLNGRLQIPSKYMSNTLLLGSDWNMDKNYGRGQVFDMTRPLYASTITTRPRRLSSIPASHILSLYAEEHIKLPIASNSLELIAGVRASQMLNLPDNYVMSGRFYIDPRINLGWNFPKFNIAGIPSFMRLAGGIGYHTKMPTMEQMYPDPVYMDLVQMNYYNDNPEFRRINLMTYIKDPANPQLRPARNLKWEVSLDFNIGGNRLSLTYFQENMTSGFRSQSYYAPYTYKYYDTSGIDGSALTEMPALKDVPYTLTKELMGYGYYTNGSQTLKKGIEYTFSTVRWKVINTRLTVNGAWFFTTYRNSMVETYRPSTVVDNKQIQFVGYYNHDGGNDNQSLNTNFTLDTDVPKLRLGFSVSAQCLWFTSNRPKEVSNYPDYYMDSEGTTHEWQQSDKEDILLRYLVRDYSSSYYAERVVPFCMNLNLKVTKKLFADRLNVALFCNKLIDYTPDYESNGATIRRHVTPYFGLEMNVKL